MHERDFFSHSHDDFSAQLGAKGIDFIIRCESISVSSFSPSIVQDEELVARKISSPIHMTESGEVLPTAFNDFFDKGMSLDRLLYVSEIELHESGARHASAISMSRTPREYVGYITTSVAKMRALLESRDDSLERFCFVYDTGKSDAIYHCDAVKVGPEVLPNMTRKTTKAYRRERLHSVFGDLIKPE